MGLLDADREFDYDTLSRLVEARVTDSQDWSAAAEASTTYEYADLGNRGSHSYRDAAEFASLFDGANRMTLLDGNNVGYDAAGNQLTGYSLDRSTAYTYEYDHHNRLIGVLDAGGNNQSAAITTPTVSLQCTSQVIKCTGLIGASSRLV